MRNNDHQLNHEEQRFVHDLYEQHFVALLNYARRLGFRDEVAEDYVQDTFVVVVRHIDEVKNCRSTRAYLIKVLKNTIGYNLRSIRYASSLKEKLAKKKQYTRAREPGIEELEPETLYRGLISDEDLDLLIQYYQNGWSLKELAVKLGITYETCKKRLLRAREHLRRVLDDSDYQ